MARSVSTAARIAVQAPQTGECFIALLTVSHASLVTPLRFARNMTDVVSNGNTFTACAFDVDFPGEDEDGAPTVRLSIDNVLRVVSEAVRALGTAPTVVLQIVLASSPNTIEATSLDMQLVDTTTDVFVVSGSLTYERMLDAQYPGDVFNPRDWPSLF